MIGLKVSEEQAALICTELGKVMIHDRNPIRRANARGVVFFLQAALRKDDIHCSEHRCLYAESINMPEHSCSGACMYNGRFKKEDRASVGRRVKSS